MTATLDPTTEEVVAPPRGVGPGSAGAPPRGTTDDEDLEEIGPVLRPAIAAALTSAAAGVLAGGMFVGVAPRVWAILGAVVGVAAACWLARRRDITPVNQLVAAGMVLGAGIVALAVFDTGSVGSLPKLVGEAVASGKLRQPPAPFEPGWRPLIVWVLGAVGFGAAWVGVALRKPGPAMLVPLPLVAFAATGQPDYAAVASGVVVFVLFAAALAVVFRADGGDGEKMPVSFELKRAFRAAPLAVILIVGLVALSQTDFLFPKPLYDPAEQAQKPKTTPLSEVEDRILFTVVSKNYTGPWRLGGLDVYDGKQWLLPPFAESRLLDLPRDGIIDKSLPPGVKTSFTVEGLEGTVLPLPNRTLGLVFVGPKLVVDPRTATVRVSAGQVRRSFKYDVAAAALPTIDQLQTASVTQDPKLLEFTDAPPVPEAVRKLFAETPATTPWERLDFARKRLLETVTAEGAGLPSEVPPSKITDLLEGSKKGTPFEIVAAQALMARWLGIPSRIGFGFDGGDRKGDVLEVRPLHGSSWLEVHFEGQGWFPITGAPKKAKQSLSNKDPQRQQEIVPSDEIGVLVFVPLRTDPPSVLRDALQRYVLMGVIAVLLVLLTYALWPLLTKARLRSKRRRWAADHGPRARIANAYAEFRDAATDLGVGHPEDTPMRFLNRVAEDDEHTELAWLVTRTIWGDMRESAGEDEVLVAEELSRSLRARLARAQPVTIRILAAVSRLSLRSPFAPELIRAARSRGDRRAAA
ncbi:MAG: hypothetical protein QOG87_918 [Actinomycetota bacterium]